MEVTSSSMPQPFAFKAAAMPSQLDLPSPGGQLRGGGSSVVRRDWMTTKKSEEKKYWIDRYGILMDIPINNKK